MFFCLCKVSFTDFFQFQGNFVDGQNNSKYRDRAPLSNCFSEGKFVKGLIQASVSKSVLLKYYTVFICVMNRLDVRFSFITKTFQSNMQRAFEVLTRIVSTAAGWKLHRGCYITNTYFEAEPCNRPSEKSSLFCKTVKEIESQEHL